MSDFDVTTATGTNGNGFHSTGGGAGSPASGPEGEQRRVQVVEEGDFVDELSRENGASRDRRRGRKAIVGVLMVLLLILVAAFGARFVLGGGNTSKAHIPVKNGNSNSAQAQSEDQVTKEAIREATSNNSNGEAPGITVPASLVVQQPTPSVSGSIPVTQMPPPGVNPNLSGTVAGPQATPTPEVSSTQSPQGTTTTAGPSPSAAQPGQPRTGGGGRNNERSVSLMEAAAASAPESRRNQSTRSGREPAVVGPEGVALPPFGSMLPVRSLGALYSLRSGSLARFELTREIGGRGWLMQKGTVLVGALRGSELDRAFVALVGFIDPASGRFIRLSGDLLGSDGATGIRGKKRKIGSSWSRVFGKLGEAGLTAATNLGGSLVGGRPIVIADAYGSSGAGVTNELDNVILNRNRNEFVEVPAGSTGYVMVTDFKETVQGTDELARMSAHDLEERADVGQPRATTGISEREMAEMVQSGDTERLRDAMPRMTPEMRRVAEAVLEESDNR